VPAADDSAGHVDTGRPAEVTFTGIASAFEATPSYDAGTCANTYCHGGSFVGQRPSGGRDTTPVWTVVDGSQIQCGSCHGMPPPAPHPQDSTPCAECHHDMDASGEFVLPLQHVDGIVTFFVNE
jgi:predicted CxxxxCH...CXXCH cytochrome family protein